MLGIKGCNQILSLSQKGLGLFASKFNLGKLVRGESRMRTLIFFLYLYHLKESHE